MGAGFFEMTADGDTPEEALATAVAELTANCYDWPDPANKPGYVQAWPTPVSDVAVEWMQHWTGQHPPEGVDPSDRWAPWFMFPLVTGGWRFYGWCAT